MRFSVLLCCVFFFAAASWFIEPLSAPGADVTEAGIVTGLVMLMAGMGLWFLVLGLMGGNEQR
jgi:hypothetical protein